MSIPSRSCLAIAILLFASSADHVQAGIILAIDVGGGPVQTGFDAFSVAEGLPVGNSNGAAVTHSYGNGISVTIDATDPGHSWQTRIRGPVSELGTFMQSDLLRDFMTSSDGFTIAALISGLTPGGTYDVELWSYDSAGPAALSDWTANGSIVQQNYSYNHGSPLSNDDYKIVFNVSANSSGAIQILGAPQNSNDGVRINGIRVSGDLNAVPEPGSLTLFGLGALGLAAVRRRRQAV